MAAPKKLAQTLKKVTSKSDSAPPTTAAMNRGLANFMAKMDKSYGEGVFEISQPQTYEVISTGSLLLDIALSIGGVPEGRMVEIFGPEGVGKTTLCLIMLANAQKKYPTKAVGFIDMEHRLDRMWAISHGVDWSRLVHVKPENAEEVADIMKDMTTSGLFSMVVLDSVGAMMPKAEQDKDALEAVVAGAAKTITRMVKMTATFADRHGTSVLLINQVRANIGGYGANEITPGGHALRHSTSMKLAVKRGGGKDGPRRVKIAGEERTVGHIVAVNIQRNSMAPAYRTVEFSLIAVPTAKFGPIGIDSADEAATLGIRFGLIELGGSWYTVKSTGERVNGREALIDLLRAQPTVVTEIRRQALAIVADEVYAEELVASDEDEVIEVISLAEGEAVS